MSRFVINAVASCEHCGDSDGMRVSVLDVFGFRHDVCLQCADNGLADSSFTLAGEIVPLDVVSVGGLLECQGCEHHVESLELVTWRDIWDSGETITGSYCPDCAAGARDSVSFPNMSARYVSQCECGC